MSGSGCRRGNAFGLSIVSDVPLPGIEGPPDYPSVGQVSVRAAEAGGVRAFELEGAEETFRSEFADGSPALTIHHHPYDGFRISYAGAQTCVVAPGGERITCSPSASGWAWDLLYAQGLPLAAALQGLEVLHASAVEFRGNAIVFAGASTAGKTTLALRLFGSGATLLADDVVALAPSDGFLLAHPGAGVMNVAEDALPLLTGRGREVGRTEKHHLVVERPTSPSPLAALVFLERGGGGEEIDLEPVPAPNPRDLLAATFVFHVRAPERLVAQLDICAQLARSVPVWRVRAPQPIGGDAVAAAVLKLLERLPQP